MIRLTFVLIISLVFMGSTNLFAQSNEENNGWVRLDSASDIEFKSESVEDESSASWWVWAMVGALWIIVLMIWSIASPSKSSCDEGYDNQFSLLTHYGKDYTTRIGVIRWHSDD